MAVNLTEIVKLARIEDETQVTLLKKSLRTFIYILYIYNIFICQLQLAMGNRNIRFTETFNTDLYKVLRQSKKGPTL